jgi:hypothetical protein
MRSKKTIGRNARQTHFAAAVRFGNAQIAGFSDCFA